MTSQILYLTAVVLMFCTNICICETLDFHCVIAYIRKWKHFIFASLIKCNNKSSFRSRRICSAKWQALKVTIIIIVHNKTHIKIPVSKIYCVLYNKNIFHEFASILKQKNATYVNKITCPKWWHLCTWKD